MPRAAVKYRCGFWIITHHPRKHEWWEVAADIRIEFSPIVGEREHLNPFEISLYLITLRNCQQELKSYQNAAKIKRRLPIDKLTNAYHIFHMYKV